jgi:hypothetical protein
MLLYVTVKVTQTTKFQSPLVLNSSRVVNQSTHKTVKRFALNVFVVECRRHDMFYLPVSIQKSDQCACHMCGAVEEFGESSRNRVTNIESMSLLSPPLKYFTTGTTATAGIAPSLDP